MVMLPSKLKNAFSDKGFLLTLLLSILVLFYFFGELIIAANTTFFWYKGDAMQVYYNALYHTFYDTSILAQSSMNYPYEESVFFTGCMPFLTFFIKILGLKSFTIGLVNLSMLFSLPACSMFIYLIFKEYKIQFVFAAFTAVAITFMTPQMLRLGGHFNLTYFFAVPATVWLTLRFVKNPNFKISGLIFLLSLFLACTHLYMYVFSISVITFGWLFLLSKNDLKSGAILFFKHYSIQTIIPFLILNLLMHAVNNVTDRTQFPFGFFDYASNEYGVFYPFNRPYEIFFKKLGIAGSVNYEGESYIGICSTIFCIVLLLKLVYNVITLKFKRILLFTNDIVLNFLIVCAVLSLLFSFCIPFKYLPHEIVYKINFLNQFRALGRFSWVFFYIINIALVYSVASINDRYNRYKQKNILMVLIVLVLSYDSYLNVKKYEHVFNNKLSALSDTGNKLAENSWVKLVEKEKYQAILSLPYFHVGSENFNYPPDDEILKNTCIVSLKTGLPMIPAFLSRTSTSQSYENITLLKEPTGKKPPILKAFNNKDILIVAMENSCSRLEHHILKKASLISKMSNFSLYKISISCLANYYASYSDSVIKDYQINQDKYFNINEQSTNIVATGFENLNNAGGFKSVGIKTETFDHEMIALDTFLMGKNLDSLYIISFWVKDLKKDQFSRTNFSVSETNPLGEIGYPIKSDFYSHIVQIDGEWTLIEFQFPLKQINNRVKLTIWNDCLTKKNRLFLDDIIYRPNSINTVKELNDCILINNRVYYKQ